MADRENDPKVQILVDLVTLNIYGRTQPCIAKIPKPSEKVPVLKALTGNA